MFPVEKTDANQLTVVLHTEFLPIDCPLSGDFSTGLQMFHLNQGNNVSTGSDNIYILRTFGSNEQKPLSYEIISVTKIKFTQQEYC